MILGAVSFSDPVMLAGLAAAAIPVALHLLNRIRSPIVMFPTLRFLKITAQKTSRRRQVQQYLLLLVRMAVFAMIAMAISRPLIRGGSSGLAYGFVILFLVGLAFFVMAGIWGAQGAALKENALHGPDDKTSRTAAVPAPRHAPPQSAGARRYWGLSAIAGLLALFMVGGAVYGLASDRFFSGDKGDFTGRSTAVVVILDNSYSMLAREDGATRISRAKEEVRQILAETVRPAEAGILLTNPGGVGIGEDHLTGDLTGLLGFLDKVAVVGRARPMKERIRAAAGMLAASSQASKMLVIVSDFTRTAFDDAEVFDALKQTAGGKNLQVVLMPIGKGSAPADVGITRFELAADGGGKPVVGAEETFEAELVNNGDAAEVKDLAFLVDDVPVEGVRLRVQLGAGGTGSARTVVKVPYRLKEPGSHRFAVRLLDVNDAMAWDDSRELVLDVAAQIKVLVLGAEDQLRARSAGYYFMAALAPFGGQQSAGASGQPAEWSIKPAYRGISQVHDYGSIAGYSAIFLCDVPAVSIDVADALARYVKEGGRVIWVLGASVNGPQYNQTLLANGRDLLPGPLAGPVISPTGSTVDWVDLASPLFHGLFDNQEPFRGIVVTGRWGFAGAALAHGRALGKLADGSTFLAEHSGPGGGGDIFTLMTSPSAAWSNLGGTVLLVPMASRMALGDSGQFKLRTSYDPGENLLIRVPGASAAMAGVSLDITTPEKAVINVRAIMSGDVPRWYFDKTQTVGLYRWRASDGKYAGMFVVNGPGEEVALEPADVTELAREVGTNRGAMIAGSAAELLDQLQKRSEGTSLAPGVLGMVMMLGVLEALMANRGATGGRLNRQSAPIPNHEAAEPREVLV